MPEEGKFLIIPKCVSIHTRVSAVVMQVTGDGRYWVFGFMGTCMNLPRGSQYPIIRYLGLG